MYIYKKFDNASKVIDLDIIFYVLNVKCMFITYIRVLSRNLCRVPWNTLACFTFGPIVFTIWIDNLERLRYKYH